MHECEESDAHIRLICKETHKHKGTRFETLSKCCFSYFDPVYIFFDDKTYFSGDLTDLLAQHASLINTPGSYRLELFLIYQLWWDCIQHSCWRAPFFGLFVCSGWLKTHNVQNLYIMYVLYSTYIHNYEHSPRVAGNDKGQSTNNYGMQCTRISQHIDYVASDFVSEDISVIMYIHRKKMMYIGPKYLKIILLNFDKKNRGMSPC